MSEIKSLTVNDKTYDCFVDSVARSKLEAAMVVESASGRSITVDDASHYNLIGLRLYGRTEQYGTPTPDAPVGLVSPGDCGIIDVFVTGENQSQIMTVTTPGGLLGIPVVSGGNYTDENGNQWICDEIDFARGVYVKRINSVNFDSAVGRRDKFPVDGDTYRFGFNIAQNPTFLPGVYDCGMCDALAYRPEPLGINNIDNAITAFTSGGIYVRCDMYDTVDDFVAWAKSIHLTVQYPLVTPIETPLPKAELDAYAALYTHRDSTTVRTDDNFAYMKLEYAMDVKKYIDSLKSSARLANVTLLASAWKTDAESLHSQVVTVSGVTPYSKVDLLPSVEQLAIFHNKDVAFVTENEDGVVTVYAIGDKPTQN